MVTAFQVPLGGGVGERVRDEHAGVGGGPRGVEVASEPRHLVGKGHDRPGLGKLFYQLIARSHTNFRECHLHNKRLKKLIIMPYHQPWKCSLT